MSSSYLSWLRYRSLQQLFYRKYCIAGCWHRTWRNVPTLLIEFSSLRYYVCVLASHMNMCAESLCVCARVSLSMCALASHKYARGEFVQARLIWVCARRVPRVYVRRCAFHMYLFEYWLWRVNSLDIEIWNRTTCHFSILDSIEVIRLVPKKYRTRYPALHKGRMLEAISI